LSLLIILFILKRETTIADRWKGAKKNTLIYPADLDTKELAGQ
jgi:hypothetical protein